MDDGDQYDGNIVSWVLDIQKQRGEPQASTRLPRKGTGGSRIPNTAAELHLRRPHESTIQYWGGVVEQPVSIRDQSCPLANEYYSGNKPTAFNQRNQKKKKAAKITSQYVLKESITKVGEKSGFK